jgi:hypothetical protein
MCQVKIFSAEQHSTSSKHLEIKAKLDEFVRNKGTIEVSRRALPATQARLSAPDGRTK